MYVTRTKQPTNVSNADMVFTQVTTEDGHTLTWTGQSLKTVVWYRIHGRPNIIRGKHTYVGGENSEVNIFPGGGTTVYILAFLQCINVSKLIMDDDVYIIDK